MNNRKRLTLLVAAGIFWTFLAPAKGDDGEEQVRRWSAEAASDLGRSLNRMEVLLNSSARSPSDRSGFHQAPGNRAGVNSFLTIIVGGVNTAMEGDKRGPSAFGLEILARSLYGKNVPTVTIRPNTPLPDFSKLGPDVIVKVDMDVDLCNRSRPLSCTPLGVMNHQGQVRRGGTTIQQLSAAYKHAYSSESVFGLGHSGGTLAITQGLERGAQLDKIILFSPQHPAGTLASIVQTAGLKPEQVLAVNGIGDLVRRGGAWNSYPHAFQHLEIQKVLLGDLVPGHSIGLAKLRTDPQVIAAGSFLSNLGFAQAIQTNYFALNNRFLFSSNAAMNSRIPRPMTNSQFNFGNSP